MTGSLLERILRRSGSAFADDLADNQAGIARRVHDSRVLIVGGAGSIGSSFIRQILAFAPAAIHVVDVAENNLVELVRDLRSSVIGVPEDFKALPLLLGSPELEAFIDSQPPYEFVLNFAAVKHVRSEKDAFSLMHMIHTNVSCLRELLDGLNEGPTVFSVSSDKAVNPANAMGASKAFMERLLNAYAGKFEVTSARFANVAFSDGSLLHAFEKRIEKSQPLAAPRDIRRYFISHEEAGQLCLLAAFLGDNREVFVPKLDPDVNLLTFAEIAEIYLDSIGLRPLLCATEEEARRRAATRDVPKHTWPCFFFDSDTTGEKMVEEFVGSNEVADWGRFRAVGIARGDSPGEGILRAVDDIETMRRSGIWTKEALMEIMRRVVPELSHVEKGKSLDQRM